MHLRMYQGEGGTPNIRTYRTLGPNLQAVGHDHRMEPKALDSKIPASGKAKQTKHIEATPKRRAFKLRDSRRVV